MSRKGYILRVNSDGTLTVKVGRAVESISLEGKERGEVFDAVKWMLISKDIPVSDPTLTSYLYDLLGVPV